jgi:hypothetical protein
MLEASASTAGGARRGAGRPSATVIEVVAIEASPRELGQERVCRALGPETRGAHVAGIDRGLSREGIDKPAD